MNPATTLITPFEWSLDQYGEWVSERWTGSPRDELNLRDHFIMSTGLPGETGEVCELLKKWQRDGNLDLEHLKKELGDVLYYVIRIATAHGILPSDVMKANVAKIDDRLARDVLHGSGDNR